MTRKGFTIIELLISLFIGLIILSGMVLVSMTSTKTYKGQKGQSDTQENIRMALETLDRLFDRWGVGVPDNGTNCSSFPPSSSKCMTLSSNEAIFYGNLNGVGFVDNASTASVISCRLNKGSEQNCYYVWRQISGGLNPYPDNGSITVFGLSELNTNNLDCLDNTSAKAVFSDMTLAARSGSDTVTLMDGDIIQRVPHRIRVYVSNSILYYDLTDQSSACNANETAKPILNGVNNFTTAPIPTGSSSPVAVRITFNVIDNVTGDRLYVDRVFGR